MSMLRTRRHRSSWFAAAPTTSVSSAGSPSSTSSTGREQLAELASYLQELGRSLVRSDRAFFVLGLCGSKVEALEQQRNDCSGKLERRRSRNDQRIGRHLKPAPPPTHDIATEQLRNARDH